MRFLNLTEDSIFCYHGPELNLRDVTILPPGQSQLVTSPARCSYLLLQSCSEKSSAAITKPDSLKLKISLLLGSSWQVVKVPSGSRWKIYATRIGGDYQFIIFPKRNLASFLAEMPDTTPLYDLLLPGTHDTMAFYGWPVYQCQSLETPLHVQLQNGIRVLDIRLAIIGGKLIAYHGKSSQKAPFQIILSTVHAFLTSSVSCRETIIVMSIKQEDSMSDLLFSRLVREEFAAGPGGLDILYLKNRIPKLGEVRGKIVLFSRFGWEGASEWENGLEGLGIHPTTWPDSEKDGFTWDCKDVHVRTHDWYSIGSFLDISEKVALATPFLTPPPNDDARPTLSIVYTSAASYLAPPKMVAEGLGWPKSGMGVEGVNSKVGKWLLDVLSGSIVTAESTVETDEKRCSWTIDPCLRGWVLTDFYDLPEHSLVDLLVECNFRGRRAGEEGWQYFFL